MTYTVGHTLIRSSLSVLQRWSNHTYLKLNVTLCLGHVFSMIQSKHNGADWMCGSDPVRDRPTIYFIYWLRCCSLLYNADWTESVQHIKPHNCVMQDIRPRPHLSDFQTDVSWCGLSQQWNPPCFCLDGWIIGYSSVKVRAPRNRLNVKRNNYSEKYFQLDHVTEIYVMSLGRKNIVYIWKTVQSDGK